MTKNKRWRTSVAGEENGKITRRGGAGEQGMWRGRKRRISRASKDNEEKCNCGRGGRGGREEVLKRKKRRRRASKDKEEDWER